MSNMENTTELTVIEQPAELVTVAKESGIEISKAELITLKYVPFLTKIREAEQASSKINFENPTELDEKIAREIRLSLVPNRTDADRLKKSEKAEALLTNGLHDSSYGVVENTSKLLELKLAQVEKQREIKHKAEIEALRIARAEQIKPYGENYATMDLGNMNEEMFTSIFEGAKLQHEAKLEAERKAEEERKEKEKVNALTFEREKELRPYEQYSTNIIDLNEFTLGTLDELKFQEIKNKLIEAKLKKDAEIEAQRIENERLRQENEAKEKALAEQKAVADEALRIANEKAESERKEAARLAKIEADKQAAIIAEQKAKADKLAAELKAKADAEAKVEAERISAEKKAAKAPDKEKIKQVAMQLGVIRDSLPILKTEEGANVISQIKILIEKTINYSREKADLL